MTVQGQKRNGELNVESIVKMRGRREGKGLVVGGGGKGRKDESAQKNINQFKKHVTIKDVICRAHF